MVGVLRLLRWPMAALAVVVGSAVGGAKGGGMLGPTSPAATTCGTWPQVGNDVSNTRSSEGGPSASQVPTLQVKWRFQATDGDFTGTPVLADCTVFVGSNGGTVRALDEQTGAVEWAENLGSPIPSSLAVDHADGLVFAAGARVGHPFVAALDEHTGAVEWTTAISSQPDADAYGSPLFVAGVPDGKGTSDLVVEGVASSISAETGSSPDTNRGELVALDALTGAILWSTFTVPSGDNGGAIWSTPSYDPSTNTLYVGTGNAYSGSAADTTDALLAVDASTGVIVNHFQATSGDAFSGNNLTGPDYDFGASPNLLTLGDGTPAIGIGQKSGTYWMLDRATLTPIWSATVARGSAFGGVVGSTAVDQSQVYGPNTLPGYLWALTQTSGRLAWLDPSADPLHYGPASVSNGVVYSEDSYGFLDCVDASSGLLLNRVPLNGVGDLAQGYYSEAYGGVSVDSANAMLFADTGSQGNDGDVVALAPAALALP